MVLNPHISNVFTGIWSKISDNRFVMTHSGPETEMWLCECILGSNAVKLNKIKNCTPSFLSNFFKIKLYRQLYQQAFYSVVVNKMTTCCPATLHE